MNQLNSITESFVPYVAYANDVQAFMNKFFQLCVWINLFLSFRRKDISGLSCNWAKTAIQLVGSAYWVLEQVTGNVRPLPRAVQIIAEIRFSKFTSCLSN